MEQQGQLDGAFPCYSIERLRRPGGDGEGQSWAVDYTMCTRPRQLQHFQQMITTSRTEPGYNNFLTAPRLCMFPGVWWWGSGWGACTCMYRARELHAVHGYSNQSTTSVYAFMRNKCTTKTCICTLLH